MAIARRRIGTTRHRRGDGSPPLATAVYRRLRAQIVTLQIAPGAPLAELDLCRRLGASRTPVRAALQRLEQEGLVTAANAGTKRRAIVSPLTPDDMRELFLMVGALDGVAAALAARLGQSRRDAVAREMERLNRRLRRLAARDTPRAIRLAQQLDLRFHRAYESAGAGPRLRSKLETLHARRERYVRVYTQALVHAHHVRESLVEHQAIIDAVRAGDPDAAERSAAFNHRNALARYDRIVAAHGERGSWT